MADVVERLRVVIEADGTATLSDGTRLSAEEVRKLGDQLDRTGGQLDRLSTLSEKAGQHAVSLGRDIAQGDWQGAATNMGRLALSTGMAEAAGSAFSVTMGAGAVVALAFGAALYQANEETKRQSNLLLLTGNYAGLVGGQLNQMAREAAAGVNAGVGNVRGTMEALVATGQVTTQSLASMAQGIELLARFSSKSREAVTSDFASMSNGVASWAAKHNESLHFITYEQYKYIESLELAGNKQEAMRVTSEALSQHLGGDMTRNMGLLERSWTRIKAEASSAWDAMLNVGREDTLTDRVNKARESLENAQRRLEGARRSGMLAGGSGAQNAVDAAKVELETAEGLVRLEKMKAEQKSQMAKEEEAKIADDREKKKNESDGTSTYERMNQQLQRRLALAQAEEAQNGKLSASELYRLQGLQQVADVEAKIGEQRAGRLRQLVSETTEVIRNNEAREDLRKTREKAQALADKDIANQERELAAMQASNQRLQEEVQQVGLTKDKLADLKAERLANAIAEERINLVMAQNIEGNDAQVRLIERRIALLERQRALTEELGKAQADDEARRKAAADNKKYAEELRRDLTRSLQRAFADGKDPLEAFGAALENTLKVRATRGLAEAIMNPLLRPIEQGSASFFGNLFSGSGVNMGTATGSDMDAAFTGYHSGGMVGSEPTFRRSMSAGMFSGAPRFHGGGITGDEVPIIAKKGEGVFTPGQMKALGAGMGGAGMAFTVNVINNGAQANVRQQPHADGMGLDVILDPIEAGLADRVGSGSGPLARSMEGRYGLRPAVN